MHLRAAFTETDLDRIAGLITANPFGVIVTTRDGVPEASHIPFTLTRDGDKLLLSGHFARANAQCAAIEGGTALAIFSGPHAYIAPGWYVTQPAVPTWDYAAVHITGTLSPVEDDAAISAMLTDMARDDPMQFDVHALTDQYRTAMYKGIKGFHLHPTKIEAQWKMSQNRSIADRESVIAALRAQGQDDVAELIQATL
jgi:transcriptional regulator